MMMMMMMMVCRWHWWELRRTRKGPDKWEDLQSMIFVLAFCAARSLPWLWAEEDVTEVMKLKHEWVTNGAGSLVGQVPALKALADAVAESVRADERNQRAGFAAPDYNALVATPLRPLARSEHAVKALDFLTTCTLPSSVQRRGTSAAAAGGAPAAAGGAPAGAGAGAEENDGGATSSSEPSSGGSTPSGGSANTSPVGTPVKVTATSTTIHHADVLPTTTHEPAL
jgi:hypothetical protein